MSNNMVCFINNTFIRKYIELRNSREDKNTHLLFTSSWTVKQEREHFFKERLYGAGKKEPTSMSAHWEQKNRMFFCDW